MCNAYQSSLPLRAFQALRNPALLGTAETVLGPLWVALFLGEMPGERTLIGGTIVLAALLCYLGLEMWRQLRR